MSEKIAKIKQFFTDDVRLDTPDSLLAIPDLPVESLATIPRDQVDALHSFGFHTLNDLVERAELLQTFPHPGANTWGLYADMILYYVCQPEGGAKKKIILAGLDNAGKTSLLNVISGKYSEVFQLLPTKGAVRNAMEVFGFPLHLWDFGGQSIYHDNYFKRPEYYFAGTDLVIYCVDIQDTPRLAESISYYEQIVTALDAIDALKVPILIVFTKHDPDLDPEVLEDVRNEIIDRCYDLSGLHDLGFTSTTIYDQTSIESVFSLAMKRLSVSNVVIEDYLGTIEARAAALVSLDGLVYGSFSTDGEEEMLMNTAAYMNTLYLFFKNNGIHHDGQYHLSYQDTGVHFLALRVYEGRLGNDVFLWVLTDNPDQFEALVPSLKAALSPLIEIFL
jgi:small GTP-binding protein